MFNRKLVLFILLCVVLLVPQLTMPKKASAAVDFLSFVNWSCAAPVVRPGLCVRVHRGRVQVGAKVHYWLPVGVLEVTPKACDFLDLGFGVSDLASQVCNSVPLVQGRATQNWMDGQNYMRKHVHIYTIPRPILEAINQAIQRKFMLPCINVGVGNVFNMVIPAGLNQSLERLKDVQDRLSAINKLMSGFSPVFISEIVSPIWLNDMLSPDAKTIAPVVNSALASLMRTSPAAGVLACPYLAQHLGRFVSNPVVDPSFMCVGHWGKGYPRIGVVRHDNPRIASALAGVRFWHLFSKTIPVISVPFSFDHRLQIAYPSISPCFRPGDPVLPQLALTYKPDRKAVFVIWKRFGCCS